MRAAARLPGDAGPRGHLQAGPFRLDCALGRGGIVRQKREGDGGTPAGRFPLRYGYYRADKIPRPLCSVPLRALPQNLGWCDDPASSIYNRPRPLPLEAGHEVMWRDDGLYDIVFVLDYNLAPRRSGRGSAIFLHCAKRRFAPTLGCVALQPAQMRRLLTRLARGVRLVVK